MIHILPILGVFLALVIIYQLLKPRDDRRKNSSSSGDFSWFDFDLGSDDCDSDCDCDCD